MHLRRGQKRLAGAQDVGRQPATGRLGGGGRIEFIDEVGKADDIRRGVVLGDVEVRRLHQRPDQVMNRRIELREVRCLAAELGNLKERGLAHLVADAFAHIAEVPGPSGVLAPRDDRH